MSKLVSPGTSALGPTSRLKRKAADLTAAQLAKELVRLFQECEARLAARAGWAAPSHNLQGLLVDFYKPFPCVLG
jgi:hypothetical protein